jgi:hypothetical protein
MSAQEHDERSMGGEPDDERPEDVELDEVDVRDLLRKALDPPAASTPPDILQGVQQRIRDRSQGKFFGDGWSTSLAPRATFLVTSLLMLLVTLVVWLLLGPVDIHVLR